MNHLEQIVGEWYEYTGYFVRRNVLVGKRLKGGYDGELDIVAFNPKTKHLVHIEPSLDADSWDRREERFKKKFDLGKKYIPKLFSGIQMPEKIEQIALFVFGSNDNHKTVGGGVVATVAEFYSVVAAGLGGKRIAKSAVPEQYALLRTVQHCLEYSQAMSSAVSSNNVFQSTLRSGGTRQLSGSRVSGLRHI
ncbi:MAG TPA: hypothetical protein ENH30_05425 [Nitrospirae bacterium]|nr:hypothetical protein [Nitrospirota bacterium]